MIKKQKPPKRNQKSIISNARTRSSNLFYHRIRIVGNIISPLVCIWVSHAIDDLYLKLLWAGGSVLLINIGCYFLSIKKIIFSIVIKDRE